MHKILVVDDEKEIRDILEEFFVKSGFKVIQVSDGQKAIEILKSDVKIDLMVLDLKMPRAGGVDVLQEIKNLGKKFPIIFLTGTINSEKCFTSLRDLGFKEEDICYKPIDLFVLLDLVKKKLAQAV